MRRAGPALGIALAFAALVAARAGADEFRAVDVYIDASPGELAAYQAEIVADGAVIAGVEGGDHAAFRAPPHYDPAALRGGRIILAAFDLGAELPTGRTRIATLHMLESAPVPTYGATLIVAADRDGHPVPASIVAVPRRGDPQ
jgi:hypothetical protein